MKRLTTILCTILLLFVLDVTCVHANEDTAVCRVSFPSGTEELYDTFGEAVTAAEADASESTITLLQDISASTTTISTGDITLDLNGKTITGPNVGCGFIINEGVTFNLCDSCYNSHPGKISNFKTAVKNNGTFYMIGGTISGCSATNGGGVYNNGTFYMSGGTISGCSASNGGAVFNYDTFYMYNGTISGCSASDGGAVYSIGTLFSMSGGTITDCSATNGGAVYNNSCDFTMSGGTISGCFATSDSEFAEGGGVYNTIGSFNFEGGTISGCFATTSGGGVCSNSGVLKMTSGSSISNCSSKDGGGIYCYYSYITNHIVCFNIYGGSITGCSATNGAGIYLCAESILNMEGGTVTGCSATSCGGGIYCAGIISLSDTPQITGNTVTSASGSATKNNLQLSWYSMIENDFRKGIKIDYDLTETVGVTNYSTIGENVPFGAIKESCASSAAYFVPDDPQYSAYVGTVSNTAIDSTYKILEWDLKKYSVAFDVQGHGVAPANVIVKHGKTVATPTSPSAVNYFFDGWFKEAACTTPWDFDNDVVLEDTTVYAKWTAIATIPASPAAMTYNTTERIGVATGEGYTLKGTAKAKAAGNYTVTAVLDSGYRWEDGTTADIVYDWSISPLNIGGLTVIVGEQTYSGTALTPDPTIVTNDLEKLTRGVD